MIFPDEDDLVEIIAEGLAQMGEPFLTRDPDAFGSALARGKNRHLYESIDDPLMLAVSVGYSILVNRHPLEDGNKRASYIAIQYVLAVNDLFLDQESYGEDEMIHLILRAAAQEITEDDLVTALRACTAPL